MVKGDVVSGILSLGVDEFGDIRPPAGEEWSIHNIYHDATIWLYFTDDVTSVWFDRESGMGVYAKYVFHVTHDYFLRVYNDEVELLLVGYDGMATK